MNRLLLLLCVLFMSATLVPAQKGAKGAAKKVQTTQKKKVDKKKAAKKKTVKKKKAAKKKIKKIQRKPKKRQVAKRIKVVQAKIAKQKKSVASTKKTIAKKQKTIAEQKKVIAQSKPTPQVAKKIESLNLASKRVEAVVVAVAAVEAAHREAEKSAEALKGAIKKAEAVDAQVVAVQKNVDEKLDAVVSSAQEVVQEAKELVKELPSAVQEGVAQAVKTLETATGALDKATKEAEAAEVKADDAAAVLDKKEDTIANAPTAPTPEAINVLTQEQRAVAELAKAEVTEQKEVVDASQAVAAAAEGVATAVTDAVDALPEPERVAVETSVAEAVQEVREEAAEVRKEASPFDELLAKMVAAVGEQETADRAVADNVNKLADAEGKAEEATAILTSVEVNLGQVLPEITFVAPVPAASFQWPTSADGWTLDVINQLTEKDIQDFNEAQVGDILDSIKAKKLQKNDISANLGALLWKRIIEGEEDETLARNVRLSFEEQETLKMLAPRPEVASASVAASAPLVKESFEVATAVETSASAQKLTQLPKEVLTLQDITLDFINSLSVELINAMIPSNFKAILTGISQNSIDVTKIDRTVIEALLAKASSAPKLTKKQKENVALWKSQLRIQ